MGQASFLFPLGKEPFGSHETLLSSVNGAGMLFGVVGNFSSIEVVNSIARDAELSHGQFAACSLGVCTQSRLQKYVPTLNAACKLLAIFFTLPEAHSITPFT